MASIVDYLREGTRIFLSGWSARISGDYKFQGDSEQICQEIVSSCFNQKYSFFQTSLRNFPQFWTRDFSWCVQPLLDLGYQKQVHQTLSYALQSFMDANKVTTTISPSGKPFDFPYFASDSLPLLMFSIQKTKFDYQEYISFLNKEIIRYSFKVIDKKTNLVRFDRHFSSIKDFAKRKSACYDNVMLYVLQRAIEDLNDSRLLSLSKNSTWYKNQIVEQFYNSDQGFFYEDMAKKNHLAADANIFPLIYGLIEEKSIIKKINFIIQKEKLDHPLPLRYTKNKQNAKFIAQEIFLKDYESTSLWAHMGILWTLFLLEQQNSKLKQQGEEYFLSFTKIIQTHHGFPEVLNNKTNIDNNANNYNNSNNNIDNNNIDNNNNNNNLFKTPFYYADNTMLWASIYLQASKLLSNY